MKPVIQTHIVPVMARCNKPPYRHYTAYVNVIVVNFERTRPKLQEVSNG